MLDRYARALRLLTFGLLGVIALQAGFLARGKDPLQELEADPLDLAPPDPPSGAVAASGAAEKTGSSSAPEKDAAAKDTAPKDAAAKGAPPAPPGGAGPESSLPERYRRIATSAIFGAEPTKQVPLALFGLAGSYAIIQTPSGQTDLVAEGGELGGVKVLKISTNRALVEYQGKQQELTIFSGLGSTSLLPSGKESSP